MRDGSEVAGKVKKLATLHDFGAGELGRKVEGCCVVIIRGIGLNLSEWNGRCIAILRP